MAQMTESQEYEWSLIPKGLLDDDENDVANANANANAIQVDEEPSSTTTTTESMEIEVGSENYGGSDGELQLRIFGSLLPYGNGQQQQHGDGSSAFDYGLQLEGGLNHQVATSSTSSLYSGNSAAVSPSFGNGHEYQYQQQQQQQQGYDDVGNGHGTVTTTTDANDIEMYYSQILNHIATGYYVEQAQAQQQENQMQMQQNSNGYIHGYNNNDGQNGQYYYGQNSYLQQQPPMVSGFYEAGQGRGPDTNNNYQNMGRNEGWNGNANTNSSNGYSGSNRGPKPFVCKYHQRHHRIPRPRPPQEK